MRKICVVLDESGNLHKNSLDKYFVLSGIITANPDSVSRRYKKLNKYLKLKKNLPIDFEIKASKLNKSEKIFMFQNLQKIDNFHIVSIVLKKENLHRKISKVNLFYNYLLKILCLSLKQKNLLNYNNINIILDQRSIKSGSINSLEDYLNIEFNYHLYIDMKINFTVTYQDSRKNFNIQFADLISNSIWSYYNFPDSNIDLFNIINKNNLYLTEFPMFSEIDFLKNYTE